MATKKAAAKPEPEVDNEEIERAKSVTKELEAMTYISNTLSGLDNDQRQRVLHWVVDRFDIYIPQ